MLDFTWKVKESFKNVRKDVENFKENVSQWIIFLDDKNSEMEKRLDKIEDRMDRLEEAMFKILSLR